MVAVVVDQGNGGIAEVGAVQDRADPVRARWRNDSRRTLMR